MWVRILPPDQMIVCSKCKTEKDDNEFPWRSKPKKLRRTTCRECQRQYCKDHYQNNKDYYANRNKALKARNKEFLDKFKSETPCADCNKTYPPCVMDFDHLNGDEKLIEISKMLNYSRPGLEKEIAKCELVCSNCHRIRTWVRRQ